MVRGGWGDYEGSDVMGVAGSIAAAKKLADAALQDGQAGRPWQHSGARWERTLSGAGYDWQDIERFEVKE